MELIVKPEFKKMMQNIIYSLKNGMKTIYDVLVDVQNVVDSNADSLDDVCSAVVANENERIQNELDRKTDEYARIENENERLTKETEREKAEAKREETLEEWREDVEKSLSSVKFFYDDSQEVEKAYIISIDHNGTEQKSEIPNASQETAGVMSSYQSFCVDRSLYDVKIKKDENDMNIVVTNNSLKQKTVNIGAATESEAGVMTSGQAANLSSLAEIFGDDIKLRTTGIECELPANPNATVKIGSFHLKKNERLMLSNITGYGVDVKIWDGHNDFESNAYTLQMNKSVKIDEYTEDSMYSEFLIQRASSFPAMQINTILVKIISAND